MRLPILVVDDDAESLARLEGALDEQGCEVRTAFDADDALDELGRFLPFIVLLRSTDAGTLALARRLKAEAVTREVSLVAFGPPGDEAVREAFEAGCEVYLSEPVDLEFLVRVVAALRLSRSAVM
jgi:PleD family two-component response regulator